MPFYFFAPEYLIIFFIFALFLFLNNKNNKNIKKFFYIFEIIFFSGSLFINFICDSSCAQNNWLAWNFKISLVKRLILFIGWGSAFLARRLFLDLSAQFLLFLACVFLGALLIIQSNNFLLLFIGLEIHNFGLCSLMGFKNRDYLEGIRKHFILSLLSGVFFLYGLSWFFQIFGSFVFTDISNLSPLKIFLISISLISIITKISLFPFHAWGTYVFQNSSNFIGMLISTSSGISFSFISGRLLRKVFNFPFFCELFLVLGLSSFVFLGIKSLKERLIKKLMFNVFISQIGLFFFSFSIKGFNEGIFFLMLYALTILGIYVTLIILRKRLRNLEEIDHFNGLAQELPFLSAIYSIFFLSLAGVPPFFGFFPRFSILKLTILKGWYIPTFLILLGSLFPMILSMRFIKKIYFSKNNLERNVLIQKTEYWEVNFLCLLILLIGVCSFMVLK